MIKLWVDDVRPAPYGYHWSKSVNDAKKTIINYETMYIASGKKSYYKIEVIDIDHDAGNYFSQGGDYIKLLDWLEETGRIYPIRIHSMNPVGVQNMRAIIQRNGWQEIH